MTKTQKATLRKYILEGTKKFITLNKLGAPKKASQLQQLANAAAEFGCHSTKTRNLVELLVGKPLPPATKGVGFKDLKIPLWAAVVPLENFGGHNYTLRKVALAISGTRPGERLLRTDKGTRGNILEEGSRADSLRAATTKEIDALLATPKFESMLASQGILIL